MNGDFATLFSKLLRLLVRNLFLKLLLFKLGEAKGLHFMVELLPILFFLLLLLDHFGVALLDKVLSRLDLLSCSFGDYRLFSLLH